MAVQILFRRGTSTEWTSADPTLGSGEPGIETDTGKIKVGDGTTIWSSLPYAAGLESLRLQDLSNVTSTTPSTGQVLKWNGTAWAPAADESGSGADGDTTYTVSATSSTGGANITLTGSDSSTDSVKLAEGSNVTITQTDNNTITISSTGTGGAANINDLGDVVITGTPTTGQVLKYDGTNWVNDTDETGSGGGAATLDELTDVVITGTPTTGQVLKYDGTNWVNGTDLSSTIFTRQELSDSTGSLADGEIGTIDITGFKSYTLLKVQTSAAAWVRIYISEAARVADASRTEGIDPAPGAGIIAEVITTGAETVLITPGAIGFNNESPVTDNIPVRVTNKSGGAASITVTLTAIQLEA
jgi:hypothetical protein